MFQCIRSVGPRIIICIPRQVSIVLTLTSFSLFTCAAWGRPPWALPQRHGRKMLKVAKWISFFRGLGSTKVSFALSCSFFYVFQFIRCVGPRIIIFIPWPVSTLLTSSPFSLLTWAAWGRPAWPPLPAQRRRKKLLKVAKWVSFSEGWGPLDFLLRYAFLSSICFNWYGV